MTDIVAKRQQQGEWQWQVRWKSGALAQADPPALRCLSCASQSAQAHHVDLPLSYPVFSQTWEGPASFGVDQLQQHQLLYG